MLTWIDILRFANNGNPTPDKRVEKTEDEWKEILSPEQFKITRMSQTERPNSSDMCTSFLPGQYACACCGTMLFDAEVKFDSGTGWPSFTQPFDKSVISYHKDRGHGMYRIETKCNICDAHLGHVFQDGPPPSGLRYCINALALTKIDSGLRKVTIGGGCFWCTEAIFQRLDGVKNVVSGYAGGKTQHPTYREVCSGLSGHAEVIEITYDPEVITYEDILKIHFHTHNPTTLNKQGADKGTQYRSIIFYRNEDEKLIAFEVMKEVQADFEDMIVTEIKPFTAFYKAEDHHQNYFNDHPTQPYCQIVIEPKIEKFKSLFAHKSK
ncbi:MAG: peptide-methionine (S)-S-oxide reductase MsrA [Chitinophagales bacterium]|nr:peptide-methionine (S)-S-oxide reductase MsrA [Chitinophagales bacterium]